MAFNWVLTLVFVFELVALALSITATGISKARRVHHGIQDVNIDNNSYHCGYEVDAASGLGIGAFVLLLVSQILITALSNCVCCGKGLRPGCARISAIFLCIISWITFCIAELFLLSGSRNVENFKSSETVSCSVVRKAVFGIAAVFILITTIFTQLYYFCYVKANNVKHFNQLNQGQSGVA